VLPERSWQKLREVLDDDVGPVLAERVGLSGPVDADHPAEAPGAPDTFLLAATRLGVEPAACAIFEDALAGVAAGRAGKFGWVVGVDRAGQREALLEHGADIVVDDLAELLP